MCELLGLSSKEKISAGALLSEFFSHAGENPHGWGAAVFSKDKTEIVKEPVSALVSRDAKDFADTMPDADLLIAHIRLATKGQVTLQNTHPFVMEDNSGTEWVLAHNGTIFGSDVLSGYARKQEGETDSERILMYLVDSLNKNSGHAAAGNKRPGNVDGSSLTADEKISTIEKVIKDITEDNKVNVLISDGQLLYMHTNYRGSMMSFDRDGAVTVSSKPLRAARFSDTTRTDEQANGWEELPVNTLMVYEKGQLIYRSVPHGNEYFEDEERTRQLFLDYANM